jgi:hypothetical protein
MAMWLVEDVFKETLTYTCKMYKSVIPAEQICETIKYAGTMSFLAIRHGLRLGIYVWNLTYKQIVESKNGEFENDRIQSIYENINTIHGNIIQTFNLGQQLKVQLGGVLEGLANNDEDDVTRRRLEGNCDDRPGDITCTNVSCQDPKKLCDGFSVNWNYVAFLKFGEISSVKLLAIEVFLY